MKQTKGIAVTPYTVVIAGVTYTVARVWYTMRGRVPVKTELFEGGGASPIAFNPLFGGWIRDNRYYYSSHDDDKEITRVEFDSQVWELKYMWGTRLGINPGNDEKWGTEEGAKYV